MIDPTTKFVILSGLSLFGLSVKAQQQRPNIIFIMSDDHARQAISCYNGSLNNTPNIDRLAEEGIRFTNCFCTNAISAPSRASILTGTFNHINGLYNNYVKFDTAQINLPKILRSSGYQTAIVGKWHLKTPPSGFDYWNILPGQGNYYNPDFITNGEKNQVQGYVTDLITEDAISWIKKRDKEKPFFIMVHHKAPHRNWLPRIDQINNYQNKKVPLPDNFYDDYQNRKAAERQELSIHKDLILDYDLKIIHPDSLNLLKARYIGISRLNNKDQKQWMQKYRSRYDDYSTIDSTKHSLSEYKFKWYMQDYLATIDAVDEGVGKLIQFLKDHSLDENTIVVYTSDQGFFLGEHGWFDKRFMYEESHQMPLIIRDPRLKNKGTVRDQMVMNIDFAPTLLEYANAEIPPEMQGISMHDIINDANTQGRKSVYYHYFEYPGAHAVQRHYGIRTDRYKLIHFYHEIDYWELYDLHTDPKEMHSVYEDPAYQPILSELKKELKRNRQLYGDTINSVPPLLRTIPNQAKVMSEELEFQPNSKYLGTGTNTLHDGLLENLSPLNSSKYNSWFGFRGEDLKLKWQLEEIQKLDTIKLRFLDFKEGWIFAPKQVEIEVSAKQTITKKILKHHIQSIPRILGGNVLEYVFAVNEEVEDIKIWAENVGICPKGHPGDGQAAWLFIEEIILK